MGNEKTILRADIRRTQPGPLGAIFVLIGLILLIIYLLGKISTVTIIICLVVLFAMITVASVMENSDVKQCSLSLTDKCITGCRKRRFSTEEIKLPIDKIDTIMASHGFFDILRGGGDTLLIRSASGVVEFPWVQNSKEFVDATLAKIEEFKQSVKDENQNLVSAVAKTVGANSGNSSSAQKIKELKELLDSGLITQEEFETKRKELLDKM